MFGEPGTILKWNYRYGLFHVNLLCSADSSSNKNDLAFRSSDQPCSPGVQACYLLSDFFLHEACSESSGSSLQTKIH